MPNTIKIKNSAVAAKVPLTTDLEYGELALNYADGKIFYKRSDNTVQSISGGGGAAEPTTIALSNKTAAYTVVAGDLGTIINCTSGTFTVSLTAAATLGAGFNCCIWNTSNTSTDAITIDPSGTETIDGLTTLILRRGEGLQIVCDGTNWQTGDKKTMRGFAENINPTAARPTATGDGSTAIGQEAQATGQRAVALTFSRATGVESFAAANGSVAFGATGYGSVAIGGTSSSTNNFSIAIGQIARATNNRSLALGYNPLASGEFSAAIGRDTTASSTNATALGANSGNQGSQAVTGSGAMAFGGSYASGTDSFAAAVANNTSTYGATGAGSVAIGYQAKATPGYGIAIGYLSKAIGGDACVAIGPAMTASGWYSLAIGGLNGTASGQSSSVVGGDGGSATANYATVIGGNQNTANAVNAYALGAYALSSIEGKYTYASNRFSSLGDAQTGTFVLRKATTDATPLALASNTFAAGTTNQVILPNNSAYAFSGMIVARRKASEGTQAAAWRVEGLIRRDNTAASTVLVNSALTVIDNTPDWSIALSADTGNGGLAVTVTGAAATNIRWVATLQTSEVTYA